MRFFNTTGPVVAADHYCVPPLERLNLEELLTLIQDKRYFVLHAPRQTGKTSALLALQDLLNSGTAGAYRCVYTNVETGQAMGEDILEALRAILGQLGARARRTLGENFLSEVWPGILETFGPAGALQEALAQWAEADRKPLVLLIDEIDSLLGDTLLAVLRQLRAGYDLRPDGFPQSVILCGVRDVRDYRIHSRSENAIIAGGSAFNVKAESLRLGDFSRAEALSLLTQHTEATGQAFTGEACDRLWTQTQGQPWLVNALAAQACFRSRRGRNRDRSITAEDIVEAQEQLILRRETHLDQLTDKLREGRVRRVVEPLLSGGGADERSFMARDVEYVRDLGLIALHPPLRIANPIYREVVPRELNWVVQEELEDEQNTAWYVGDDGELNVIALIAAFQQFFREGSEHWLQRFEYQEAGPQLLLQAFLQRIVNGGGRIEREYGLGRGRTDLLIVWPWKERTERFVVECKILRNSLERTMHDGLEQTAAYMDRCAAQEGHLVIFDRRAGRWEDKVFHRTERAGKKDIHVWGM